MSHLSPEDEIRIENAAYRILEDIGVKVEDESVYEQLLRAGAKSGSTGQLLHLPKEIVQEALQLCPPSVRIGSRNGPVNEIGVAGGTLFWTGNALHISEGRSRRHLESSDLSMLSRIADSCETISGMVGTSISDYQPAARDFVGFHIMAQHTGKHLRPCIYTPAGSKAIVEMAEVLADGTPLGTNPLVSFGYSVVSPLHWPSATIEIFRNTSGKKIPLMINSEPLGGVTAPVTLAGCLAMGVAEGLSGLVIAQHLEPERPIVFNLGFAHMMDMSTAMPLTGSPENALLHAAGAQLSRHFKLPSASWVSTESMTIDSQAAFEKMMTAMSDAWAGVNIIWGAGNLESTLCMSPEMLIIDDEIAGTSLHYAKGIEVNEEMIALDIMDEVIHKGSFLDTDHTLQHFRTSIRHSNFLTRSKRAKWEELGSKSMEERASERVRDILSKEIEPYLTENQDKELQAIETRFLERI